MGTELLKRTVIDNPYIPKFDGLFPSQPQAFFLTAPADEILYGGAAGGGKSGGLLAAGLQYADCAGYDALIVRRSYTDLEKPGGLIPLSRIWLAGTDAVYNEQVHRWLFPSGATLSFGHIQSEASVVQDYQGSAFAFIGFDELTQFSEFMYRYLFSRRRKAVGLPFPTRTRATSNPGGIGHEWVRRRFIDGADGVDRIFVPARLEDNPGLDRDEYDRSLAELDPVTRAQLRHGDWNVRPEGGLFKRAWFTDKMIDAADVPALVRTIRYWDLAATKKKSALHDPDYAAGCKLGKDEAGTKYILDMRHFQEGPEETERRVNQTAISDGTSVSVRIEQEPGSTSKLYINVLSRRLEAYDVHGMPSLADKLTRARPASAACERGDVKIVRGAWVDNFLDELCAFPEVAHDDQVDAFTGVYTAMTQGIQVNFDGGYVGTGS